MQLKRVHWIQSDISSYSGVRACKGVWDATAKPGCEQPSQAVNSPESNRLLDGSEAWGRQVLPHVHEEGSMSMTLNS